MGRRLVLSSDELSEKRKDLDQAVGVYTASMTQLGVVIGLKTQHCLEEVGRQTKETLDSVNSIASIQSSMTRADGF
jgi:hypothetical protein